MPHSNMEGAAGGNDKVFCSKPARGWSHSDKVITTEGVTFNVRGMQIHHHHIHTMMNVAVVIDFFFITFNSNANALNSII